MGFFFFFFALCFFSRFRLPFNTDPDVALGIAVKTFLDEMPANLTIEERRTRAVEFPTKFVPFAIDFPGDLKVCMHFVEALYIGVRTMGPKSVHTFDWNTWEKAHKYLQSRHL